MPNRAARTAWGPMVQVVLEQFVPQRQRIIVDELAYRFLPTPLRMLVNLARPEPVRSWIFAIMERQVPGIRGGLLCRKRYIDEKLLESLDQGIEALVILGAGMDTRAYRIPGLSALKVFEVDLPEVVAYKQAILKRVFGEVPAHIRWAPIDFDRQDLGTALQGVGYTPESPSFFIWEGVTQYVTEAAVCKVFEYLQKACPGSRLVFTFICQDFIAGRQMYGLEVLYRQTRVRQQFWQFGMEPGQVSAFLKSYGWRELEQAGSAEYQARYLLLAGRVMPVMEIERSVYAEKAEE